MEKQDNLKTIDSKVILLGSPTTEKTSIICRAVSNDFDVETPTTNGACYITKRIELPDANVNLQLWDLAGQERFQALAPMYYRGTTVTILTFSLIEESTLYETRNYFNSMTKELSEMPILFLVGNKCDLVDERVITTDEGFQLAKEFNATYYEVSSKTGYGIDDLFLDVAIQSVEKLCQEILVISSIKFNFNDAALNIGNMDIYLTFSIKNNPHVNKITRLSKNSFSPVSFYLFDKKPNVLTVNIYNKLKNTDVLLADKIDFPISDSKKIMQFEKNVNINEVFSKKETAYISFNLERTNYKEQMKAKEQNEENLNSKLENKDHAAKKAMKTKPRKIEFKFTKKANESKKLQDKVHQYETEIENKTKEFEAKLVEISNENKKLKEKTQQYEAEIERRTKEYEAKIAEKTNEILESQDKIHKYEAEMERRTKEYEAKIAEKTNEIKESQDKIHKYEAEMERKTKEYEDELTKKSNEIKDLQEKMRELIENQDKEKQKIINDFQNRQTISESNGKSINEINTVITEKVNNSSKKVNESIEKNDEDQFFFGIEDEAHFETIKKLGEGLTSVAYKIIDNRTRVPLCKKVLKVEGTTFKDLQNTVKEFHLLHNLRHPCICYAIAINISEICETETETSDEVTTVALLLEFVDFNLKDCLAENILNSTLKTRIVVEISHAMQYLHAKGLIYRDLKIDNIMLNSVFQVKLIDFGLARINECLFGEEMMNSISMTKCVGNAHFMSPEMMREDEYDSKTDVFSFGIVLYVIFFGKLPKQTMKEKAMGKEIIIPEESSSISSCCIELMKMCIAIDPKDRPSFEEILEFLRKSNYMLSPDVDPSIVEQRDKELESFKLNKS